MANILPVPVVTPSTLVSNGLLLWTKPNYSVYVGASISGYYVGLTQNMGLSGYCGLFYCAKVKELSGMLYWKDVTVNSETLVNTPNPNLDYYVASRKLDMSVDSDAIFNNAFGGTFTTVDDIVNALAANGFNRYGIYPITYHCSNSNVSGPSEAAVGDTVTVSAVPDVGYGITDASTQIIVTNNDVAVPYTWDATNQRITFTMPDPT